MQDQNYLELKMKKEVDLLAAIEAEPKARRFANMSYIAYLNRR